jgi:DNA (cytosine-5)-methyltransferase 1
MLSSGSDAAWWHGQGMATTVDVYCGCGGLTLGARQAGFVSKLAIDVDPILTSSFQRNFPDTNLLLADASTLSTATIIAQAGRNIDGLLGGPPCQAFSEIGRSHPNDPRRHLVRHFFRLAADLNPKFFLMENVRGLGFDRNLAILQEGLDLVQPRYKILGPMLLDAADFGAATSRRRLFIIGFDPERMDAITDDDIIAAKRRSATVRDAIADLRDARYERDDEEGFDIWRHDPNARPSPYAAALRRRRSLFTGHRRTEHAEATRQRFAAVKPGSRDEIGKHSRLSWSGQCPTIRAGTGSDRGSFQSVRPIHPSAARVITVREAARLQGFHDGFLFHPTIWHSFRMIGNSVSPSIAKALLSVI